MSTKTKTPSKPTTIGTTTPLAATSTKKRPSKPSKRPTTVAGTNERIDMVVKVIENDRSEFDKAMEVIAREQAAQDMALATAKDERTALAGAVAKGQEQTTAAFKAAATARQDLAARVNGNTKAINKMAKYVSRPVTGFGFFATLLGVLAAAITWWVLTDADMTQPYKWLVVILVSLATIATAMALAPSESLYKEDTPTTKKKEGQQ